MFYGLIIFGIFLLLSATVCILCLLRKLHQQEIRLNALVKSNENITLKEDTMNPLGKLFEPDTKSLSLSVTKDGKIKSASDTLLNLLGFEHHQR